MTIDNKHNCTRCNSILEYTNKGSWYNARKRKEKQGFLHCKKCKDIYASEANKGNPKITGRPVGSKNTEDYIPWNKGLKGNADRINKANKENPDVWFDGLATRHGFNTYEEYRASLPALKRYRTDVKRITENQPLHTLENIEKRSQNGTVGGYTLDHRISVLRGFKEGISPEVIGHITNLQMLPWRDNISKGWK